MHVRAVAVAVALVLPAIVVRPPYRDPAALPVAEANDNRRAAGRLKGDTLFVDLELRQGRWYPEAPDGAFIEAPIVGESGRAPQVPAPLLRVREGTVIVARLTNRLPDSAVTWYGLGTRPGQDSLHLAPGRSTTLRFLAGKPGTYTYRAQVGHDALQTREREQTVGAFVVDARGAATDDRIFVLNAWGEPTNDSTYRSALAINGRGWPYTERLQGTRGEPQRWRVVNGTIRMHPMHLHGFYFRVLSKGDGSADSSFAADDTPLVVTEPMRPFETMEMEWTPERPGNWLFHCHLSYHVIPETRYTPSNAHQEHFSGDVTRHMAGLVLGISVKDAPGGPVDDRSHPRTLRLLLQEGHARGRSPRMLGPVLQEGAEPARDSARVPGATLFLTRGEATDINVVNRLAEPVAIHWHGIELESWSDGVAGWSGAMDRLAPPVAAGDSFTAHLTLPRAGTFIYHTHLNDVETLTSGLYGALIVSDPGKPFDPRTDHVFVVGRDGDDEVGHVVVNGDSMPAPLVLQAGVEHRLRFVFIVPAGGAWVRLLADTSLVKWRTLAKDGAELPARRQVMQPATVRVWAGQTYDYGVRPEAGTYRLVLWTPQGVVWEQRVEVR